MKLFYSTIKNAQEFQSLDDKNDNTANELITPGIYGNSHIPEVFEHMIEDETYDDYGLNSGQRYIIKRSQIKSINISINPPPYTAVEVQGIINSFVPNGPASLVGGFSGQGNGMTTALAVDYDMWRMYGFKEGAPVSVPFLNGHISQCAPYASMLLSRNRKNILRGSVTISGNEFMQPGEVVFLEDRQLLFYVTSVRHNFTFGTTFTTTLELSYGHTPGEYIPTVTDMIGKMIYNNKDSADTIVHRQESSANELSVGVILRGAKSSVNKIGDASQTNQLTPNGFSTSFSAANSQTINNLLYNTRYLINSNDVKGNNAKATIELRIYFDNQNEADADIYAYAQQIEALLIGQNETALNAFATVQQGNSPEPLPYGTTKVVKVNLDDQGDTDRRSPSQKAINAARNYKQANPMNGGGASDPGNNDDGGIGTGSSDPLGRTTKDDIRTALFKYVVDCWVSIEQVPAS
jgi:hypothetical protein